MMDIRLGGDAKALIESLGKLPPNLQKAAKRLAKVAAEKLVKEVRSNIVLQHGAWVPLQSKYFRRKTKAGKDPRMLIRDKTYLASIKSVGAVVEADKEALRQEFGTSTMPARPHWYPALQKLQGSEAAQMFAREILHDLFGA